MSDSSSPHHHHHATATFSDGEPLSAVSVLPTVEQVSIPTTIVSIKDDNNSMTSTEFSVPQLPLQIHNIQIALDPSEQVLFQILRETATAFDNGLLSVDNNNNNTGNKQQQQQQQQQQDEKLVFRIAGGWVRDKVLQLQTHDVDVAVNCSLSGVQAAQLVQHYCKYNNKISIGKMGIIAANPSQSKHLETATMRIHGIDVDFCNLRGMEVYQTDSRIPSTTKFGTPYQDAMRRDFTLNALFWNLQTNLLEDWTGRGLKDLQAAQLVTPLDAATTFRDDPLRVLRAIRFAVRYQFQLDKDIENAAKCMTIHQALHVKVSRERVGKELEGMLTGKGANPILALRTISRLQLAGPVFSLPIVGMGKIASMKGKIAGHDYNDVNHNTLEARHVRELGWEQSACLLDIFQQVVEQHELAVALLEDSEKDTATKSNNDDKNNTIDNSKRTNNNKNSQQRTTYDKSLSAVMAFLLPFRDLLYREVTKEKWYYAITFVIREGIKFKNTQVAYVTKVIETLQEMLDLVTMAAAQKKKFKHKHNDTNDSPITSRLEAGLVLKSVKEGWVTSLLLATCLKILEQQQQPESTNVDYTRLSVELYQTILQMGLDGSWRTKPLLDGRSLIKRLELKQGPLVKQYHDEQYRWMLLNPNGSRDDCEEHLRSYKRKLEQNNNIDNDNNDEALGMSDGTGRTKTSPSSHHQHHNGGGNTAAATADNDHPHYQKKMHVESMDLSS